MGALAAEQEDQDNRRDAAAGAQRAATQQLLRRLQALSAHPPAHSHHSLAPQLQCTIQMQGAGLVVSHDVHIPREFAAAKADAQAALVAGSTPRFTEPGAVDGRGASAPPRPSAVTLASAASTESEGGALVVSTSLLAAATPLGHVQLSQQVEACAATSAAGAVGAAIVHDCGVAADGQKTAALEHVKQVRGAGVPATSAAARHVGGTRFKTQVGSERRTLKL
jgi:hypothetical protein